MSISGQWPDAGDDLPSFDARARANTIFIERPEEAGGYESH